MKRKYELQVRINHYTSEGKLIRRGSWMHWKYYKTLEGMIQAYNYYRESEKEQSPLTCTHNGKTIYCVFQYRPINLLDV